VRRFLAEHGCLDKPENAVFLIFFASLRKTRGKPYFPGLFNVI
jgi:hypothetical protein